MKPPAVLVVDDDPFFRTFCSDVLRQEGFEVQVASSGREALGALAREGFDLVLADIYMPEMTGLELLQAVKARSPSLDVLIMTGYASIDTAVRALKQGAADYLRKPFAAQELVAVVESTLAQRRLYRDHHRLKRQLELYELTRSFASVDEPDRVLHLGLEAACHATGSRAGMVLRSQPDGAFMDLVHCRGVAPEKAKAVRRALVTRGLRHLRSSERPRTLGRGRLGRILGDEAPPGLRELLLLPLVRRGAAEGMFLLLRYNDQDRLDRDTVDNGLFVVRQVELAYEAALRYQQARHLAFVDPLTDLYNARYLERVLEESIEASDRSGRPFAVLFLDLDRFKEINDAHGHLVGGKVLIEVSRLLRSNVREGDVLIRYGGDEFVAVLPGATARDAMEVAQRTREAIRSHRFLGREGRDIRVTASVGIATYPEDARTCDELIDKADRAMYRNKEATRDAVYEARLL